MKYSLDGLRKLNNAFEKVYFILGNHDLFYRETRDVNSVEFAKELPNIILIDSVLTGVMSHLLVGFDDEWKKIPKIKSKYMFGHFELPTFKLNAREREMPDKDGLKSEMFTNQEFVFSGHFHHRQVKDNVIYTDNAFPHNFSDSWDDEKLIFLGKRILCGSDAPKYKTITLSSLLENPEKYLLPKTNARVSLDIDISYEGDKLY